MAEQIDLTGWVPKLTYGYSLDVYAKGSQRVGVDRLTGKVVISYTFREGGQRC